ncbi:hypothetical protein SBA6_1050017 [Candidatus Sulfopaludibacter sp. SbA6]|nr:hypothetical protein SBA6_1050017 [Candidatus Sulfopaludibacter sp. SbA6]
MHKQQGSLAFPGGPVEDANPVAGVDSAFSFAEYIQHELLNSLHRDGAEDLPKATGPPFPAPRHSFHNPKTQSHIQPWRRHSCRLIRFIWDIDLQIKKPYTLFESKISHRLVDAGPKCLATFKEVEMNGEPPAETDCVVAPRFRAGDSSPRSAPTFSPIL